MRPGGSTAPPPAGSRVEPAVRVLERPGHHLPPEFPVV